MKIIKQIPIVLAAACFLAIWGWFHFHDDRLGSQSTENFYKTPSDLTKAIGEIE